MNGFIASGQVVDVILAVLVLEVLVLGFRRNRRGRRRLWLGSMILAALPGACLLLALKAALTGADWSFVALWLAASFPAHLADLWRRPP